MPLAMAREVEKKLTKREQPPGLLEGGFMKLGNNMKKGTKLSILTAAALGLAAVVMTAAPAYSNDFDQAVRVTFTSPVEIPNNGTLPPGTYWLEKVDRGMSTVQNVMEISNARHTRVVATAMLQPIERQKVTGHPFVGVASDPNGAPVALTGWYYPGNAIGYELVYSHQQRNQIREQTDSGVVVSQHNAHVVTSHSGH
jgi:hypothetical protein